MGLDMKIEISQQGVEMLEDRRAGLEKNGVRAGDAVMLGKMVDQEVETGGRKVVGVGLLVEFGVEFGNVNPVGELVEAEYQGIRDLRGASAVADEIFAAKPLAAAGNLEALEQEGHLVGHESRFRQGDIRRVHRAAPF